MDKTNFFKKVITSIYDIKVFSKYAKEGIFQINFICNVTYFNFSWSKRYIY